MYERHAVQPGGHGNIGDAECCRGAGRTGMSSSVSDYHVAARVGDQFAPDPRAARAYQEINKVYATLTTFTDPLFRSMADGLQGLERAPGPGRR